MPARSASLLPHATERLVLRAFRPEDLPTFLAYRRHPDVARYQSWDVDYAEERAQHLIASLAEQAFGEPGHWYQVALERRDTGQLIGDLALKVLGSARPTAEMGWSLAPDQRGRGYATEAVSALLDLTFGPLGCSRVSGLVDVRNAPSIALLERLGFRAIERLVEHVRIKGELVTDDRYELTAREWLARRSSPDRG